MAKKYDNVLDRILSQLEGFLDFNRYQSSVDQAVAAQEATARTGLEGKVAKNLAGRGIDPNSAYAQSMFTDLWAPMQNQFASARAGAASDYYRSILNMAPMLLQLAQSARKNTDNGWGMNAPPGVAIGTITNPDFLNDWSHAHEFTLGPGRPGYGFMEEPGYGWSFQPGMMENWLSPLERTYGPIVADRVEGWLGP